jgi:hypothetical protein
MLQQRIEYCANGCCRFVGGKAVTGEEYKAAVAGHPGSYAGLKTGQRDTIVEHQVACRGIRWAIRKVVNKETQPISSSGGQVFTSEAVSIPSEPLFTDDAAAKKHAEELGEEYFIEPVITAA